MAASLGTQPAVGADPREDVHVTKTLDAQWDTDRTWTIPNILSFLRLLSVLVFGALIVWEYDIAAVILLVIFGASDWLDGFLARTLKQRTELGAKLDPVADRLYIAVAVVALLVRGIVPWWFVVILLARDVMMFIVLLITRRQDHGPLRVNYIGKAATFALLVAFPALLIGNSAQFDLPWLHTVGWVLAGLGALCYWTAGALYIRTEYQLHRSTRQEIQNP